VVSAVADGTRRLHIEPQQVSTLGGTIIHYRSE
jgi:hypothetical protein